MFGLHTRTIPFHRDEHRPATDREILTELLYRMDTLMTDFTKLSAAVAQLQTDNTTLIGIAQRLLAGQANPGDQATVDALAGSITGVDAADVAAIAAATPAAPTGPSGTTGLTGTAPSGTTGA